MPVPGTNDEEWDRLEPASALDALVELVLHGEYNGMFVEKRSKDGMELRAAALGVIQVNYQLHLVRLALTISSRTSSQKMKSGKLSSVQCSQLKVRAPSQHTFKSADMTGFIRLEHTAADYTPPPCFDCPTNIPPLPCIRHVYTSFMPALLPSTPLLLPCQDLGPPNCPFGHPSAPNTTRRILCPCRWWSSFLNSKSSCVSTAST